MMKISDPRLENRRKKFDPRDFAVFRHVWSLTAEESALLDRYYLKRGVGTVVREMIITSHNYKDTLLYGDKFYEVSYRECGLHSIVDHKNILLSFRHNIYNNFSIVLISPPFPRMNNSFDKVMEL